MAKFCQIRSHWLWVSQFGDQLFWDRANVSRWQPAAGVDTRKCAPLLGSNQKQFKGWDSRLRLSSTSHASGADTKNLKLETFVNFGIPTYLPTYLPPYLPTYLPTNLPTYFPTYQLTYLPTYLPTYLLTYLPTYLPTCMNFILTRERKTLGRIVDHLLFDTLHR